MNRPISNDAGLPTVGITMGDPAGIGPEICVKALASGRLRELCCPIIIGDGAVLAETAGRLGLDLDLASEEDSSIQVVEPCGTGIEYAVGRDAERSGRASARFIETAVDLWKSGKIDAICTAPISKRALSMAGYNFPGHTEFLAHLTDTPKVVMSFFAGNLRVVLLSTHVSLKAAIALVTSERLTELILFADLKLSELLRRRNVKLAVAGLNPHASEGGMFGSEESAEIGPAILRSKNEHGIDVSGPYSPDTIFLRAHRGEFDAVIALYHDQATIPVKSLSFGSAVNVTLGLPLIRTSVDHGTAFDIAGRGVADASSMIAAIELAARLAQPQKGETALES